MRNRNCLVVGISAFFVCVAFHGGASAASFDCTKAATPREKLICGDPALSALDDQLGETYRKRKALLSSQGAEMLQRSEQGWLRYVTTVCPIGKTVKAEVFQSPKDCIRQEYQDRLNQLADAGKKLGPFVVNRIDLYRAIPSNDEFGARFGFLTQHAAFPQIDSPLSPDAEAWNRKQVKTLPLVGDCGDGDYVADFDLDFASERLISVQSNFYEYCHGAAHGMGWGKVENTVLSPTQRPLKAEDLFGASAEWRPALQKLFWDKLTATGWSPPDGSEESIRQQMDERFVDPASWMLTHDGIQISFSSYEGGCYACTPQPVTVPWTALKPLLSPDAAAP